MPFVRRRPLLRAAAVGGGAYLAGKHTAQRQAEQQMSQEQQFSAQQQGQAVPAPRSPDAQVPSASMADQLKQLVDLHSAGALSDDEFAVAKSKLLGS